MRGLAAPPATAASPGSSGAAWRERTRGAGRCAIIRRMGFLSAQDEQAVKQEFERIGGPVKLVVFASELGPETNAQTVALVKEVAALSDKLSVSVLNPHIDREQAHGYGVEVAPAAVGEGAWVCGI